MGKMRQFRRALRSAVGRPLAYQINDGYGAALAGTLERVIRGERVHDAEIKDMFAVDDDGPTPENIAAYAGPAIIPGGNGAKATAMVSVRGVALYDLEFQPYCFSTLLLAQTMNALANDPEIGTIVLDIDSPGGVVTGTPEAADAIFAARKRKKVVALVNPLAASAAYWLASQAEEIIAVPSADIGSIGVFMMHTDCSKMMGDMGVKPTYIFAGKYKVEGNPYEPLTEEAKAYLQSEVDSIYAAFLKAVARGRGISVEEVEAKFGQGRTMLAPVAKRVGMIDDVATIQVALSRFGVMGMPAHSRRRGEGDAPAPSAEASDEERLLTPDEVRSMEDAPGTIDLSARVEPEEPAAEEPADTPAEETAADEELAEDLTAIVDAIETTDTENNSEAEEARVKAADARRRRLALLSA